MKNIFSEYLFISLSLKIYFTEYEMLKKGSGSNSGYIK